MEMNKNIFNIRERDLQFVPRWVITRNIHSRNVAEHSFYIALWALRIAEYAKMAPEIRLCIVRIALIHDVEETITGDIPSPFKSALNKHTKIAVDTLNHQLIERPSQFINEYNTQIGVGAILKFCDHLEAAMTIAEERSMGNKTLEGVFFELMGKMEDAIKDLPFSEAIKSDIGNMAMQAMSWSQGYQSGIVAKKIPNGEEVQF